MPSPEGYIVPYPETDKDSDPQVLGAYNYTDIILRLPGGKRIRDIKWLSVWCRRFTKNFLNYFHEEFLLTSFNRDAARNSAAADVHDFSIVSNLKQKYQTAFYFIHM
ncbi:hypothetical protein EAI_15472 [Harpegnathos saltator]|uniref:DM13 domain-containing protein n=1 Tax=Harpegnathos saltator TaxID=610380 RepID=E2BC50_HARSA|nr:hypothetical protein EAI_15472 [Harpegnathos saltator]